MRWVRLTAFLPLAIYLPVHAYQVAFAASGRSAFAEHLGGRAGAILGLMLVVLPLGVHAAAGIRLWSRGASSSPRFDGGLRDLQRWAGIVAALFLVAHLGHTSTVALRSGAPWDLYERLRVDLSLPFYVGIYVVGIVAVVLHYVLGLAAAAERAGDRLGRGGAALLKAGALVLGLSLGAVFIDALAHFAVGRSLFFLAALVDGDSAAARLSSLG